MKIKRYALLLIFLASFVINTSHVSAFDERFYTTNDIFFYNPDAIDCGAGQATTTAKIDLTLTGTTKEIYDYLTSKPLSTNGNKPLNAAQASGIMGNFYAESGFNPAAIEDTTRTDKGHGLAQWTFGRWNNLEAFAQTKGTDWTNLTTQLEFLKSELEGPEKAVITDSDFATTKKPAVAAKRFLVVFERADPDVANLSKREGAAVAVYNAYSGLTATTSSCTLSNGVVAGNIVKTALGFAIPTPVANGTTAKSSARDTYQAAKPVYNPTADWTDCGGYVATVMIASGVDKEYQKLGVTRQINYVKSNPGKYQINLKPKVSDLRPGDILLWTGVVDGQASGHTTIFTGEATYPSADASLGERIPSVRNSGSAEWMVSKGAISARVIK